ncbi:hypothetical protein FB567DRAFT_582664 [Paraphoma chrysanthemicola]|uniref:Uncharacterized protein n=1 Tax=Paraphoma chrysanthemicola TaxID=798071 RepID=A0A8K0VUI6_9PLEO|nr:hypothetical protein FB567DRAFT_582664 [Paraphoma chrysanthemicola]
MRNRERLQLFDRSTGKLLLIRTNVHMLKKRDELEVCFIDTRSFDHDGKIETLARCGASARRFSGVKSNSRDNFAMKHSSNLRPRAWTVGRGMSSEMRNCTGFIIRVIIVGPQMRARSCDCRSARRLPAPVSLNIESCSVHRAAMFKDVEKFASTVAHHAQISDRLGILPQRIAGVTEAALHASAAQVVAVEKQSTSCHTALFGSAASKKNPEQIC